MPSTSKSRKWTASSPFSTAKSPVSPPCWNTAMNKRTEVALLLLLLASFRAALCQDAAKPDPAYVLGPEDQLVIRVLDIEEVPDKPFRIDMRGNLNLPIVGRVHAAGFTVEQLE